MEKELFSDLLKQNIQSCSYAFDAITEENSSYRLNENTASVGFIFRHVAETMALFGYFFAYQQTQRIPRWEHKILDRARTSAQAGNYYKKAMPCWSKSSVPLLLKAGLSL